VAINTGINLIGDMADWENIVPSTNGFFSITCSQYTGPIPTGGTASGPYAYALGGFRLEEINTNAPRIFSATSTGNQVQVLFSLPVDPVSASMPVNYTVTNEYETIAVLAAATGASNETGELTTARQLPFMRHWLTVNRVADSLTATNPIAPNSQIVYTNIGFTSGYVKSEFYLGLTGTSLSALTNSTKYPNSPNRVRYYSDSFWYDQTVGGNYGNRMSGLLVPSITGPYIFVVYSAGTSLMSLSTN